MASGEAGPLPPVISGYPFHLTELDAADTGMTRKVFTENHSMNGKSMDVKQYTFAFVILHYGDPEVTDTCVQSILHMGGDAWIVVVNNDARLSSAEHEAFARRYAESPAVIILRAPEGAGFSRANNIGYVYAREQLGADTIIVCNNDIEFIQTDFLQRLACSISRMDCHVLGPNIVRRSNHEPQNPMDARLRTEEEARYTIRMNRWALKVFPAVYPLLRIQEKQQEKRRLAGKKKNPGFYRTMQKHIIPFGACLIFTPQFVEREEKAFDPETQFYYEEYILVNRCFREGYETGYDPSMKVLHETGSATKQSTKSRAGRMKTMMLHTADAWEVYVREFSPAHTRK